MIKRYLLWRARQRDTDLLGPHVEGMHWARILRRSDVFPLCDILFGGLTVRGPRDPDACLRAQYGPSYHSPPPEAQRRRHGTVTFDS